MTSVDRILQYEDLEQEAPEHGPNTVPDDWPEHGCLEFDNINLRYIGSAQLALKDISIQCRKAEKVDTNFAN